MEPIYRKSFEITDLYVDCFGKIKPSAILFLMQEAAGHHSAQLGLSWDALASRNLFWAVVRHRVQITRLPRRGETVTAETWPMPTTRTAYPRAMVIKDSHGNELLRSISLWVLMDLNTRAMILPGKSGVEVPGNLCGTELAPPHSIMAKPTANATERKVQFSDLDRNGHMNNTRYMDWVQDLLPSSFHGTHEVREFTVCYLSESREGQTLTFHWELTEDGALQVDAQREGERIFAAQILYRSSFL